MTEAPCGAARCRRRLVAPEPGWTTAADVIVVGSGIAGLTTALRLRQRVDRVLLVTKTVLDEGSTRWAQGGIAAALDPGDSPAGAPARHARRRLRPLRRRRRDGSGPRGPDAGPRARRARRRVRPATSGELTLTREGGHHRDRIAHAGGDATGKEISRALIAALARVQGRPGHRGHRARPGRRPAHRTPDRGSAGSPSTSSARARSTASARPCARAVVLATGGLGQVYSATTNPSVATGDGMAAALRAGAVVADLEFVQFHPTVLWLGVGSQRPAAPHLRGGPRRGRVPRRRRRRSGSCRASTRWPTSRPATSSSRAIVDRMRETGHRPRLPRRPAPGRASSSSSASRRSSPAAASSGSTRRPTCCRWHRRSTTPAAGCAPTCADGPRLAGLYACGEASCTGVHGANRLASNSLLEGLVFAHRIADDLTTRLGAGELPQTTPVATRRNPGADPRQAPTRRAARHDRRVRGGALGRVARRDAGDPRRARRLARSPTTPTSRAAPRAGRRPTCSTSAGP